MATGHKMSQLIVRKSLTNKGLFEGKQFRCRV